MAEALAVVGIANNVLQLIEFGGRLCLRIKELSSLAAGCPGKLKELEQRLRHVVTTLKGLNEEGRAVLEHEQKTLESSLLHAEKLDSLLKSLHLDAITDGSSLKSFHPKTVYVAFRSVREEKKIEEFQRVLDRLIDLVDFQLQVRNTAALDALLLAQGNILRPPSKNTGICVSDEKTCEGQFYHATSGNAAETTKHFASLPYDRNSGFVGREEIISSLEKALRAPYAGQRRVVLYGLGGVGKSQIASEYAFRRLDSSPEVSIFWIHAETRARFEENYKRMALEADLARRDDPNVDVKELFRDWLDKRYEREWLFVVDNVDDKDALFSTDPSTGKSLLDYLPRSSKGSVLFTTRNRDIAFDIAGDVTQAIRVEPMGPSEAAGLLVERIGQQFDLAHAKTLFEELEYLPLAIAQAAAYMQKRQQTVTEYLQQYHHNDSSKIALLGHKFVAHGRESRNWESVMTTWSISFRHIQNENPLAADLLSLMSFFDRQGIPRTLLPIEDYDLVEFNEAIGILEAFSLIESMHNHRSYDVHRLVQLATRTWVSSLNDRPTVLSPFRDLLLTARPVVQLVARTWVNDFDNGKGARGACRSLLLLATRFPEATPETLGLCAKYLPHAEKVLQYRCDHLSTTHQLARERLSYHVECYLRLIGGSTADIARAEKGVKRRDILFLPLSRVKLHYTTATVFISVMFVIFLAGHWSFRL